MERESFVFYRSFRDALGELPSKMRLQIHEAIADYSLDGVEPELTGVAKAIWLLVKPQLDANTKRYVNGCKGSESGHLGGRPRKRKTPTEPQTNPNETPNDNVNDNVNDNENDNDNNNKKKALKKDSCDFPAESLSDKSDPFVSKEINEIVEFWNSEVESNRSTMVKIRGASGKRRAHIMARMREHGADAVKEMLTRAVVSDFLNGRNDRGWIASFDWLMLPDNFSKIIEGNYDNRKINDYGKQDKRDDKDKRRRTETAATCPEDYEGCF